MKRKIVYCAIIICITGFILYIGNNLICSIFGITNFNFTDKEKQLIYSGLGITDSIDIHLDLLYSTYFNQQVKIYIQKDIIDFFKSNMNLNIKNEAALKNEIFASPYSRNIKDDGKIN